MEEPVFSKRTVFVVGAGASCEFGFPVGVELARRIPQLIDFRWSSNRMVGTGDDLVLSALGLLSGGSSEYRNELTKACGRIRDGLPLALSIDNFVHQHSSDVFVATASKVAIIKSILDAERQSKIYTDRRTQRDGIDFSAISDTWFVDFMRYLNAGVTNTEHTLSRVSFIVFNYDRSIEHLIFNAIKKSWSISDAEASALSNTVNIVHPYGSVGPLSWQDSQNGIDFGDNERRDIHTLSKKILTFTEQINDTSIQSSIASMLDRAELIIFLGFAYYKQNMEIIKIATKKKLQTFGTVYEMSESDGHHVKNSISFHLKIPKSEITLEKLTCSAFFSQYGRSLADI